MTTKMPSDPKFGVAVKSAKSFAPISFARYRSGLVPPSKTATVVPAKPVGSTTRVANPPTSYINPERLMDDVAELYAARDRVFGALDALDAASRNAGTPIRSGSPRESFTHLFGVIREVETTVRKTWQEELNASGGADLSLSKALTVGAKIDALYVSKLTRKDAENSRAPNANDRESRTADPDRTPPANSSDHDDRDDRSDVVGEDDPFANSSPYALAFKPRTATPKLIPVKSFGYSLGFEDSVRRLLKDGGWGTDRITHGELVKLVALFADATSANATETIRALSDTELKLIANDMDSNGIGNYDGLSTTQKEAFIAKLATQLDAEQFVRIAKAFDDDVQIAAVLARTSGTQHLATAFIAYCEARFNTGSIEVKNSAALATAIVLADMSPENLVNFLNSHGEREAFLTMLFSAMSGHTQTFGGAKTTRIIHRFDPALLLKINQLALTFPRTSEPLRFEIFKRTIATLEWMQATSTDSGADNSIKQVLNSTTALLMNDLATHLNEHSNGQEFYVSWIKQLLLAGEHKTVAELVAQALRSPGGDYRWAGYMLGIITRATDKIDQEHEDAVNLASDIVSALLNAAPLAGQISGEILKATLLQMRADASKELSLKQRIEKGLNDALNGPNHIPERDRRNLGFFDAIGTSVKTA